MATRRSGAQRVDGLDAARHLAGLNRVEVAERLGVTPQAVLRLERDWRAGVAALDRYVRALGGTLTLALDLEEPGRVEVPVDEEDLTPGERQRSAEIRAQPVARRPREKSSR